MLISLWSLKTKSNLLFFIYITWKKKRKHHGNLGSNRDYQDSGKARPDQPEMRKMEMMRHNLLQVQRLVSGRSGIETECCLTSEPGLVNFVLLYQ